MNLPRVHGTSFTTTLHVRERSPITEKQGCTGQAACKPISLLPKGCFFVFHCPSLKSDTSLRKNWTQFHFHLTRNNILALNSLTEKASLHACAPSLDQQQLSCVPQPACALPEVFIQRLAHLSVFSPDSSWDTRQGTGQASCYSGKLHSANLWRRACDQPLNMMIK